MTAESVSEIREEGPSPSIVVPDPQAEFTRRVEMLMEMMAEDPAVRDRIIAETYVNIAQIETSVRGTVEMIQREGLGAILKSGMKRKRGKDNG